MGGIQASTAQAEAASRTEASTSRRSIPFHRPAIGEDEIAAVVETMRSGWLTMGPQTREFEVAFAEAVGVPHAVAVSSCTAGLHLALNALELEPGAEVITSTYTFAATAAIIIHCGLRPVLVDCRRGTLDLDPEDVARKISPQTRGIIPVHFGGHPAPMDEILEIARPRGIAVIDDAAHAVPASYRGRNVGTLGRLTAFSFYATKNITTGEGGMVTTADAALAEKLRVRRLHGMSYDAWKRYSSSGTWRYDILYPGFKYNTTDVNAALGLVQLKRMYELRDARRRHAERYAQALKDIPGLELPPCAPDVEHAWHLFVVRIDPEVAGIHRDAVIEEMKQAGIGTSVHFIPLHLHSYYRETYGFTPADFPVASEAAERALSLPLYPSMMEADVDCVSGTLRAILERARA